MVMLGSDFSIHFISAGVGIILGHFWLLVTFIIALMYSCLDQVSFGITVGIFLKTNNFRTKSLNMFLIFLK